MGLTLLWCSGTKPTASLRSACIVIKHEIKLPRWLSGKESACQCRSLGFDPWVGKSLWRRKWQPTPVFLPAKSHGQCYLASYSPQGLRRVGHDLVTKQQQRTTASILASWSFCFSRKGSSWKSHHRINSLIHMGMHVLKQSRRENDLAGCSARIPREP